MEVFVESLELLDIGTACEGDQPSFHRGKNKSRTILQQICDLLTLCSTQLRKKIQVKIKFVYFM